MHTVHKVGKNLSKEKLNSHLFVINKQPPPYTNLKESTGVIRITFYLVEFPQNCVECYLHFAAGREVMSAILQAQIFKLVFDANYQFVDKV